MIRSLILTSACVVLIAGGSFALHRAMHDRAAKTLASSAPLPLQPRDWDMIVALPNGSSLLARHGTAGRALIDWLATKDGRATVFELGGRQFAPGSSTPSYEDDGRIPRLVMMLGAYPDVDVEIVGHTNDTGHPQADQALSLARAAHVAGEVRQGGIAPSRITVSAVGSTQPLATDSPLRKTGATDDRVTLMLHRHDSG